MEAIEFLKEAQRLCSHYDLCAAGCPLYTKCVFYFRDMNETKEETEKKIEQNVAIIEKWSKEHPIITNAMKFKEVFGFMPEGWQTFYFADEQNGSYTKTINWQDPYKEP